MRILIDISIYFIPNLVIISVLRRIIDKLFELLFLLYCILRAQEVDISLVQYFLHIGPALYLFVGLELHEKFFL